MTDKNDLAQHRTAWAEDRTVQANERTFAGWMRTGMACVGVAIGLKAVFGDFEPTWMAKAVATLFLFIAVLIYFNAQRMAAKTLKRLSANATEPLSPQSFRVTATLLSIATIATGAILWAL